MKFTKHRLEWELYDQDTEKIHICGICSSYKYKVYLTYGFLAKTPEGFHAVTPICAECATKMSGSEVVTIPESK